MDCMTLREEWNGHHFADNIFKYIFLNEKLYISITISLKFLPKGPINNAPLLVQVAEQLSIEQMPSNYLNQW